MYILVIFYTTIGKVHQKQKANHAKNYCGPPPACLNSRDKNTIIQYLLVSFMMLDYVITSSVLIAQMHQKEFLFYLFGSGVDRILN